MDSSDSIPAADSYDVLIIGAGPAGLVAAAWMTRAGVRTLIIEKELTGRTYGHADGIESRTFEILDTFDLGHKIWAESNWTLEVSSWRASEDGILQRFHVGPNCHKGTSRYHEGTLAQGRVEKHLWRFINQSNRVESYWGYNPTSLKVQQTVNTSPCEYPIHLEIKKSSCGLADNEALPSHRTVNGKFLIGCDGAHSWIRKVLGLKMVGNSEKENWGVLDCIPITNFPDIRKRCIIQTNTGCMMIIPRERSLVRLYVQLKTTIQLSNAKTISRAALDSISKILHPFFFDTKQIEWASSYAIAQRLCKTFSMYERIFLAGDALHTHSPKAGQGMNVSMQDSYNLGWKIASVVLGTLKPEILTTYQMERLPVALQLLSFDKTIYDAICPKSRKYSKDQLVDVLRQENTSASGLFIIYSENMTISTQFENEKQRKTENVNHQISCLASKVTIGGRFPDQVVIRHSDSRPCHMLDLLPGSGQWHLLVFGGNIADKTQMARLRSAGHFLGHERSIFFKANRERLKTAFGSFEVFLIHSAVRHNIELFDLPRVFLPFDETYGYDYSKVYADNVSYQGCGGSAYSNYGISNDGCIILVRPDQHVAFICGLEGTSLLEEFVSRFHYMA